jgi:NiFe hydrogenase small subunit HydA
MQELNLFWLQGQSCDGDSMSVIDAERPDFITFLERNNIKLLYHPTLSPVFGDEALKLINDCISGMVRVDILVFEGSVPSKEGFGDFYQGRDVKGIVKDLASKAMITVAVGTCAAFGGIPSAPPNESGAMGLQFKGYVKGGFLGADYMSGMGFPVINIPGCPTHPDWVINTIQSFRLARPVVLDKFNRPKDYFEEKVHRGCKHCEFHERALWAKNYTEVGCYAAALGCKGRTTNADCNIRLWNGVSSCTRSGAPCIGCCDPGFPVSMMPFSQETLSLPDDVTEQVNDKLRILYGGESK